MPMPLAELVALLARVDRLIAEARDIIADPTTSLQNRAIAVRDLADLNESRARAEQILRKYG